MAKVIRAKANQEMVIEMLKKYSSYDKISQKDRTTLRQELLKTTDNLCPFSGGYAGMYFTVEHFKPKGDDKHKYLQLEWKNLFPCLACCNRRTTFDNNNPPYNPEEVDYVDVISFNSITNSFEPKLKNDKQAQETIRKYVLTNDNQDLVANITFHLEARQEGRYTKGDKYPFYEYIESLFNN